MLYVLIIIAIVIAETKIKNHIEKNRPLHAEENILKGKITIRKHYNYGMMLNFLENKKELVKKISSAALGFLIILFAFILPKKGNKLYKLGLSLIIGGAISNVVDRIKRGYVIDYFSINYKKLKNIIFNLSDIFIFVGSVLVVIASFFFSKSTNSVNHEWIYQVANNQMDTI
ncbi:MAG: signal peptidase II [Clostridiales bacterium]|nr:signal peptidase II [Clostridiales bacterium]